MPKKSRRKYKKRKSRTRKKRGAVKFGKNKTTAEIVKEGRKILQTTAQRKKRKRREQQIKLTGEKEFALFKKQALNEMRMAFQTTFGEAPSNRDRKIISLVYKSLKEPLSKVDQDDIKKYRTEDEKNKRKFVWMNLTLRRLKEKSQLKQLAIYKHGDNPKALLKYSSGKKKKKPGPATGLVVNTDKYMSPVKGPDTRYPKLSLDIGERAKSHKNLFNKKKQAGRKKKTRKKKKRRKKKTRNKKGKGTKFSKNASKKSYKKLDDDEELSNERMKELTKALGMQNQGIKELKDIIKQNYEKDDGSLDTNKLNDDLKEFGFKTDMEKFVEDLQKQDK